MDNINTQFRENIANRLSTYSIFIKDK